MKYEERSTEELISNYLSKRDVAKEYSLKVNKRKYKRQDRAILESTLSSMGKIASILKSREVSKINCKDKTIKL